MDRPAMSAAPCYGSMPWVLRYTSIGKRKSARPQGIEHFKAIGRRVTQASGCYQEALLIASVRVRTHTACCLLFFN